MFALCVCSLWPAITWNSTLRDEFLGQSPKRLSIKLAVTHTDCQFIRLKGTETVQSVIGNAQGACWCVEYCPSDASLRSGRGS